MKVWHLQSIRYIIIGLVSNLLLYLIYLSLTGLSIGHKTAMTLLFAIGTMQTFVFNKRWTFAHQGFFQTSFLKYLAVYGFAYLLNLMSLLVFADYLGLPHQIVQGVMILALAIMLFILQKYWVFRKPMQAMKSKSI